MTGRRVLAVAALAVALTGCGVPTGGQPSTIPASDVPYGLAEPSPAPTTTSSPRDDVVASRVHWVTAEDTLVSRARDVDGTTRRERLTDLLDQLAAGPTGDERDEQLSTALPPEVTLDVAGLDGGTATIDLNASADAPAGIAGRRAVAQIVLTATSVPGVESVLLELAGEPIEAPLPDGELTDRPLTAQDYAAVTSAAPPPAEPPPAGRVEPPMPEGEPPVPAPPS